ncbi:VOC family protein [Paenisporosarcina cavernae]|uniref:VOC family protein n=1 Tax=Paenisporosarcina cavernae TaxID=2320858 RepID=A0A385YS05_9BACL|nr:VOC family protein [Paenisporosarcina cavernae]AYC28502.1 VOC family protein [Paenisporosarcina cavernae]
MSSKLKGVEGIFIPVTNTQLAADWYESILGCQKVYVKKEGAVVRLSEHSHPVLCLVETPGHTGITFPDNNYGVEKYVNFLTDDFDGLHAYLLDQHVQVNAISGEGKTRYFTFLDPDGNPLGVCQSH